MLTRDNNFVKEHVIIRAVPGSVVMYSNVASSCAIGCLVPSGARGGEVLREGGGEVLREGGGEVLLDMVLIPSEVSASDASLSADD